jgi:hypothetical protein
MPKEEDKENQHLNINSRADPTASSQRSTLPQHLVRNEASSYILNQSYSQHSVVSSSSTNTNPLLDKQIREINKQKEFLLKLQRDKEELERQMRDNERVMNARMQKMHEERLQMEKRLT